MTRINVAINPRELPGKLLLAEHREIKRIPNNIKKGKFNINGIPTQFTLGTGHVKFFYNKLLYLKNRYLSIHQECVHRGYNVQDFSAAFNDLPLDLMNDYTETQEDRNLLVNRIHSKNFTLLF